jgi:hypothetical protein
MTKKEELGFSTISKTLNNVLDKAKQFLTNYKGNQVVTGEGYGLTNVLITTGRGSGGKGAVVYNDPNFKGTPAYDEKHGIKKEEVTIVNHKGAQVVTGQGYGLGSVLITTGRGSGGKGPVVYDDPAFKGTPANDEMVRIQQEDAAAMEAQERYKQDLNKLQNMASPDSNYEDYPAHMEPYLRDQSAGIQDDYLRFVAQSNQRMSRSLSRVNGGINYYMGFVMETQGLVAEGAALTRGATRIARNSSELAAARRYLPGERMPNGRIAGESVGSNLNPAYRLTSGNLRTNAVNQLKAEFGETVLDEYVVFYRGTSTKTPLTTETLPPEVFATQDIDLAAKFAQRKVGKPGVGGDPEVSAILFPKEEFENMVKQKAFRQREIPDMPGKSEIIFQAEDIDRRADLFTLFW